MHTPSPCIPGTFFLLDLLNVNTYADWLPVFTTRIFVLLVYAILQQRKHSESATFERTVCHQFLELRRSADMVRMLVARTIQNYIRISDHTHRYHNPNYPSICHLYGAIYMPFTQNFFFHQFLSDHRPTLIRSCP
jgi:hypothetical protein